MYVCIHLLVYLYIYFLIALFMRFVWLLGNPDMPWASED